MKDGVDFGGWLAHQLKRREWSASDFARRTKFSTGIISAWLSNKKRPSTPSCKRIADAFGVEVDLVLVRSGHKTASEDAGDTDPASGIIPRLRRVDLTKDSRARNIEALLDAWWRDDTEEARSAEGSG